MPGRRCVPLPFPSSSRCASRTASTSRMGRAAVGGMRAVGKEDFEEKEGCMC
jgi:hypothetical protein